MPNLQHIMGFDGFKILNLKAGRITQIRVEPSSSNRTCIHCLYPSCRIKENNERRIKHLRFHQTLVELIIKCKRFYCQKCKKSFSERLPGIKPRSRASESFKLQVFEEHQAGHSQKHLSKTNRICESTVGRWNKSFLIERIKETASSRIICPEFLGIDEHHFTKKLGFATTLVALGKNHRVFDVILGRSADALTPYLNRLKEKERVKIVTMDLSETYRSIVKKHFINAKIVADRFHVIRLVMQSFYKVLSSVDTQVRYNRGLLSLIRRHPKKLKVEQQKRLKNYLESNPVLNILYEKREELLSKLRLKGVGEYGFKKHIQEYLCLIEELKKSQWSSLQSLGETLESWSEETMRMWRYTKKHNGVTEGFHNKMELISRRAYGFRNFQNYRMRVLALCGWDGIFARRNCSRFREVPRLMM